MNAGSLNRPVTIQYLTGGADALGQRVETWSTFAATWANIRFLNGVETAKAGIEQSIAKASIRIRYRTDITAAMRVVYHGITYQINAVLPDEAKREFVDLSCEAIK